MDSKTELNSFIQEFLDKIDEVKAPNSNHMGIQRTVHDCVFLLLRLGYDVNTLHQLTGVDEKFLRKSLQQLGLRAPTTFTTSILNKDSLPHNATNEPVQKSETPSKIESFMETVQTVKEQSQKNSAQSLSTVNNQYQQQQFPQQQEQTINLSTSSGKNWLSKSKVSLNDSDEDEESEKQPEIITSAMLFETSETPRKILQQPVVQLISLPEFSHEEKKFQKVYKSRLKNLSNTDLLHRHGSLIIEDIRNKLISDVDKFMDYVVLLKNREVSNYNETHPTRPGQSHRKAIIETESHSPKQEVLINDSFVKMTKVC